MKQYLMPTILTFGMLLTTSAFAATISVEGVSGKWTEAEGANVSGKNTSTFRWGRPQYQGEKSGYSFTPYSPSVYPISLNTPFKIGDFTHFNFPITGDSITSADLLVDLDLAVDATPVNGLLSRYRFLHNETPNVFPCTGGSCDDIVSLPDTALEADSFTVDGVEYNLQLYGFLQGNDLYKDLMTAEGQATTVGLFGILSAKSVDAPEPEVYLTLATFLAIAFLVHYRRKKRAQSKT